MTKEQFLDKWVVISAVRNKMQPDLESVIATEIAKSKEPQTSFNPIAEAYERGEKIRKKNWGNQSWYKKYDEKYVIANCGNVYAIPLIDFNSIKNEPEKWEIYKEPTEQPSSQVKLDNSFDKDRFERMFRAVIETHEATMNALKQLDAYYASKEGGNNG